VDEGFLNKYFANKGEKKDNIPKTPLPNIIKNPKLKRHNPAARSKACVASNLGINRRITVGKPAKRKTETIAPKESEAKKSPSSNSESEHDKTFN
jgi:hypothetical protein